MFRPEWGGFFLKILHRHHDGHMSKMAANLASRGSCGAWTQPLPLSHTDFKTTVSVQ